MSDYIKREDAIFVALQQPLYSVVSQIRQLDGIDIVRCRECKFWQNKHLCATWSAFGTIETDADDYCSYGERKSDE